jgi:hypothetical protein
MRAGRILFVDVDYMADVAPVENDAGTVEVGACRDVRQEKRIWTPRCQTLEEQDGPGIS